MRRGNKCYCPAGQTWSNAENRCVKPVVCYGGTIRRGDKCYCPAGQKWSNAVDRCISSVACSGGRVRRGDTCSCPEGQTWSSGWNRCVKAVVCYGGTVRRGDKCYCPQGQKWSNAEDRCISPPSTAETTPPNKTEPLTPGSAMPGLLSGAPDYEAKYADYQTRRADIKRRLFEISRLRNQCRDRLPACSQSGAAYDEQEAIRRRDRQYSLWGEASYYIPWSESLSDVPPELERDIGTWGGIKVFGYGGDKLWIWLKGNVKNFGSTPEGGDGLARQGWQKAYDDNQGFQP
ncbi:hypothetical protein [Breoghania sp. L-A4]|uniref:hypothetical protein n=1 Tax=Breoghania sp. L-A4 TaxID=2304600 RepID=UPI0013C34B5F|nr:hypothetical protein [Breoghania sp. L-A4]